MLEWPRRSWTTLGWTPGLQEDGRVGVTQALDLDPRKADSVDVLAQQLRDAVGVQGLAVGPAEGEAFVLVAGAQQLLLLLLRFAVLPERRQGRAVEGYEAAAALGLRRAGRYCAAALRELLDDGDAPGREVDVAPPQSHELAASQAPWSRRGATARTGGRSQQRRGMHGLADRSTSAARVSRAAGGPPLRGCGR